ncbi:Uncharacterized protein FWK35_00011892 [Aphis craccivora]|uniref:Uncharacterized protein n=1 Tax=Aphis craccivora TaxID=307492 RepID=A0A6G0ZJF9_APHCR|nr:Uncharacterized protein FWK35_00011892 [Aphis craccivora]
MVVFELVRTSAVAVATKLTLCNNTFKRVDGRGFVLHNLHTVLVQGNTFNHTEAEAFYESTASSPETRWSTRSVLRVSDNSFLRPVTDGKWLPAIRLQRAATEMNVTGNTFNGSCGCGPWRFVAVTKADNGVATTDDDDDGDAEFADRNYFRANKAEADCANLTSWGLDRLLIAEFTVAAGCDRDDGVAFDLCVRDRAAAAQVGGRFSSLGDVLSPTAERGVITTVVLLVLCGFGAVCAVSAVTWLNARGYFIKLRSLLTPNGGVGGGGGGGGGTACRTMSAHSLSRVSVHEYAELQRLKLGGGIGVRGSDVGAVRVIVYQDKGTQTVPEELTHEMLQNLRDKLDDPDDYAEARGIIEHLYDLIRVEETCCGGDGGSGWYSTGGRGLDDVTSTVTTKSVIADDGRPRDVKSVGTGAPSLDRLRLPRIKMIGSAGSSVQGRHQARRPQPPPSPSPSVNSDYVDPVDLLYGGIANVRDDESYADIYCELTDLRSTADDVRPPQQPPPVPDKPTPV